jgi:hypothetical protein
MKRMLFLSAALAALALTNALLPAPASGANSCSSENAKCKKFCDNASKQGDASGCYRDCAGRLQSCKQSGCYYWRQSPTVCGLTRK